MGVFFFFGHTLQLVGSQFLDQGLNLDQNSGSPVSSSLGHQGTPLKFVACTFGVISYKSLPSLMSQSFPMFSCKYIVLGFTFRYLIHSDLIFAHGASTLTFSGCSQHIPEATQSHLRKRFPYFPLLAFSFTHVFPPLPKKHLPLSHEKAHKKCKKTNAKIYILFEFKKFKIAFKFRKVP